MSADNEAIKAKLVRVLDEIEQRYSAMVEELADVVRENVRLREEVAGLVDTLEGHRQDRVWFEERHERARALLARAKRRDEWFRKRYRGKDMGEPESGLLRDVDAFLSDPRRDGGGR